jgi:translocation and assembly module TamB
VNPKRGKKLRWALALLAVSAAALGSFLRTDRAGELICQAMRAELPRALGHDVKIGSCRVLPFDQAIRLTGVSIAAKGADQPLAEAETAEVSLRGIFLGSIALSQVTLTRPRVRLDLATLPKPSPQQANAACPLELLKTLSIDRLEITNAEVELLAPDARVSLTGVGLNWEVRRGAIDANLELLGGSATVQGRTVAIGKSKVEGELDLADERATLRRAEVQVDGATASITGKLEALCETPEVALTGQVFVPLSAVGRVTGQLPGARGSVWVRASANGKLPKPSVRAEIQATDVALPPAKPGDISARVAFNGKEVTLEELHARVGLGWVKVQGAVKLDDQLTMKATVESHEASLAQALEKAGVPGSWVEMATSVKGGVSGHLLPKPELAGDFDAKIAHFRLGARAYDAPVSQGIDILAIPNARAAFRFAVQPDRIWFSNARVQAGPTLASQATADVSIYFDFEGKGVEVNADATHLELKDFGQLAGLDIDGKGSASVHVYGPPASNIAIDGQVALRDFVLAHYALGVVQSPARVRGTTLSFDQILGQKGKTQFSGQTALNFKTEGLYVKSDVVVTRGRTEDLIDVIAGLHPNVEVFQGPLTGDVEGEGHIDSPGATLTGTIALNLKDTRYYDRNLGAGAVTLRFDHGEALVVEPMKLVGPLGATSLKGRWSWSGPLDFEFGLEGGSLAELINPDTRSVSGRFQIKGSVGGDTTSTVVNAWLTSPEVYLSGYPLGPSHLELRLLGRELDLFGVPFGTSRGKAHIVVKEPYPLTGGFSVDLKDLKAVLPTEAVKQGVTGTLGGKIALSGNLLPGQGVVVGALLDTLSLSRDDFAVRNEGPVEASWHKGKYTVARLVMRGTGTEVETEGTWGPETADLKSHGAVDLRWVEPFAPTLERTGGRAEFAASVTGSTDDPEVAGTAEIQDAHFLVRGSPFSARSVSGRADFSRSRVLLSDFAGFVNDGKVRARADVKLSKFSIAGVEANLDVEEMNYAPRPDWPTVLTGNVLFYGKPDNYTLAGSLDVVRFRYEKPMVLEALQRDVRERRYASSDQRPQEWLKFDLDLALTGDVRMDNNLAKGRLGGRVKLLGTNVNLAASGTIEALDGSQAYFRGNQLNIERGLLTFNGSSIEPTFDLTAHTQIREYLVKVKAFGRLDDPKVAYNSEPALSEADVVSLLTLGITSHDQATNIAGAGLAADALFSASGLNRQVQRFLGKNEVIKEQRVNLSTTYNEGTGQAEPSLSWESKILTEDFKVGVTQPMTGRGTKAQAEYRFNKGVSARAQWDNQSTDSSVGNPGVDLKFRFEWE